MNITETLNERGKTHGDFTQNAGISQEIKRIIRLNDHKLTDVQREALDMIVHKISRILAGDPNHADSWHDIAGYSKLAEDRIEVLTEALDKVISDSDDHFPSLEAVTKRIKTHKKDRYLVVGE